MSAAPTAGSALLELDGVSVRRGSRTVVHDVDLRVGAGEVVAVLGPNGAGKSTLLEAAGGLGVVSAGRVARTGRVATVLQQPGLAGRSVLANVELALAWWKVPRSARRARAMAALERMHAGHLAGRTAHSLSGGERRRVHVARGIAVEPDLLLLDEPFAGLDPETRLALCDDTASALRTSSSAVVVVVHDRAEAWALADRLLVLMAGRVVADGAPDALLAAPPSAPVARFLGFDGELRNGEHLLLTRDVHVELDPPSGAGGSDGDRRAGVVERVVPRPDVVRVQVRTDDGLLWARHDPATPAVRPGDAVGLRLVGGVTFPS